MITSYLKTAWRNFKKNSLFSGINILGLSIGFAGFILSYQYINRETSYDTWNPNRENIYLVGLTYNGDYTDQTPPSLAPAIMEEFSEIVLAGRAVPYMYGSYPIFGKETARVKNALLVDSAAATIFQMKTQDGRLFTELDKIEGTIANEEISALLFHKDSLPTAEAPIEFKALSLEQSFYETFYGITERRKPSVLAYDMLLVKPVYDEVEHGNSFTFQTYIQVEHKTDIAALTEKISRYYEQNTAQHHLVKSSAFANGKVYLDPLTNLHLQPKHGSTLPYITIWVLGGLSVIILILSAINFTNLVIAQSENRAKEIGIKKLFGVRRSALIVQFMVEVFIQCLIAAGIAWFVLIISSNALQKWFNDDLSEYLYHTNTLWQLGIAIVMTTAIAGIYPALFLSGFKPIAMLRGNRQTAHTRIGFRTVLLTFQFVIASIFISGIIIINSQLDYMRSSERGFETEQVISFKGMSLVFEVGNDWKNDFRSRLINSGSITHVATTSNSPAEGQPPVKKQFHGPKRTTEVDLVGVDLDYFDLLSIPLVTGRNTLTPVEFEQDTINHFAVINESMAKAMDIDQPLGQKISGCDTHFTIIGVVKDYKAYGFENKVAPAVYSFKDECGASSYKLDVLIRAEKGKTKEALAAMDVEWKKNPNSERLPLDYTFMDNNYAQLQAKEEQLKNVSSAFATIAIVIAALGLFNLTAYHVTSKRKEVSIRKVLGASILQLFFLLNKPFLKVFVVANLVAIPIGYFLLKRWLENFAYQINLSPWPFIISAISLVVVMLITISIQSLQAAIANPVDSLRDE
ncbi:ABC transporter permease [Sphingobacterium sp. lm-10]|uniref:ABC transporter permease n=1 Tax=Sphingobacterium sp. lm-10 TaxID=2944904 RepID=UPI00202024C9|nr:ABC transporter permease [Sphingobacterium sp. lm-10]MCL7988098.1 ABC transporter permease [Sphingobacterium sp. lm-10]